MKDKILELLMLQKFIKRKELLLSLQLNGYVLNDRQMRAEIESLIVDDHYCIQSSEQGYSLITCLEDLEKAVNYLDKKAEAIAIRKNSLIRNYNESRRKIQLELSL